MIENGWLESELAESVCRLSDVVNSLLDTDGEEREFSKLEGRLIAQAIESVQLATGLVERICDEADG